MTPDDQITNLTSKTQKETRFYLVCERCGRETDPQWSRDLTAELAYRRGWRVVRKKVYCHECGGPLTLDLV